MWGIIISTVVALIFGFIYFRYIAKSKHSSSNYVSYSDITISFKGKYGKSTASDVAKRINNSLRKCGWRGDNEMKIMMNDFLNGIIRKS